MSSNNMYYAPVNGVGHSPAVIKTFTNCYYYEERTESCGQATWIGIVGDELETAVGKIPEAKSVAHGIQFTTAMQAVSLVAPTEAAGPASIRDHSLQIPRFPNSGINSTQIVEIREIA